MSRSQALRQGEERPAFGIATDDFRRTGGLCASDRAEDARLQAVTNAGPSALAPVFTCRSGLVTAITRIRLSHGGPAYVVRLRSSDREEF